MNKKVRVWTDELIGMFWYSCILSKYKLQEENLNGLETLTVLFSVVLKFTCFTCIWMFINFLSTAITLTRLQNMPPVATE